MLLDCSRDEGEPFDNEVGLARGVDPAIGPSPCGHRLDGRSQLSVECDRGTLGAACRNVEAIVSASQNINIVTRMNDVSGMLQRPPRRIFGTGSLIVTLRRDPKIGSLRSGESHCYMEGQDPKRGLFAEIIGGLQW